MFIVGKKLGMTRVFNEEGKVTPVTVIMARPMTVTQIKTKEKDGYGAIQFGFDEAKKIKKPQGGHLKGLGNFRCLREFQFTPTLGSESRHEVIEANSNLQIPNNNETNKKQNGELKKGEKLDVSVFDVGDIVKVSGISKAKGFQGVVKRHGFAGAPKSHGHKGMLRRPGSIGQRFPQHTLKGMRMAGRMGGIRSTVRGLEIMSINKENNLLAVKGAVPGRRGAILEIVKIY